MNPAGSIARALLALAALAGALFAQDMRAELSFTPASAAVGQPVHASLVVQHDVGSRPKLDGLGLDESWLVLDSQAGATLPDPSAAGRARTTFEFELASLEPGERAITELALAGGAQKLAVAGPKLAVTSVLAEGEDAPRPLRGLREIESVDPGANSWLPLAATLAALTILATGLALWLRRRARGAPELAPAPSVRLAVLEARPLDTPQDVQAAHFALTRLLRESADLAAGRDRSGMTDEEWRGAASAQFDAAGFGALEQQQLEALLERAARVKYGSERPTHWATREALASARSFAARLETSGSVRAPGRGVAA